MRPYLPTGQAVQNIQEYRLGEGAQEARPGPLNRKGDARSQKLKVVCEPCNIGWMGDLQNLTKPVLLPLLIGERKNLSPQKQKTLVTWATMFTMVYETCNPNHMATTPAQRATFKTEQSPPEYWIYWCAPFSDNCCPVIHIGFASHDAGFRPVANADATQIHKAQLTLCGGGGIAFLIFSTADPKAYETFAQFVTRCVSQVGYTQLWPSDGLTVRITDNRTTPLTWKDLLAFRDTFIATLESGYNAKR